MTEGITVITFVNDHYLEMVFLNNFFSLLYVNTSFGFNLIYENTKNILLKYIKVVEYNLDL